MEIQKTLCVSVEVATGNKNDKKRSCLISGFVCLKKVCTTEMAEWPKGQVFTFCQQCATSVARLFLPD